MASLSIIPFSFNKLADLFIAEVVALMYLALNRLSLGDWFTPYAVVLLLLFALIAVFGFWRSRSAPAEAAA